MSKKVLIVILVVLVGFIGFVLYRNNSVSEVDISENYSLDKHFTSEYFKLSFDLPSSVKVQSTVYGTEKVSPENSSSFTVNVYDLHKVEPLEEKNGSVLGRFDFLDVTIGRRGEVRSLKETADFEHMLSKANDNFETTDLETINFHGTLAYKFLTSEEGPGYSNLIHIYFQRGDKVAYLVYPSRSQLSQNIVDSIGLLD